MHRISLAIIAVVIAIVALTGCNRNVSADRGNAVYYWRTTLKLDDKERQFLRNHDIKRIYMRYFDVDAQENYSDGAWRKKAVPNATIGFDDSIPSNIEVVPVVFITGEGIEAISKDVPTYASKLYMRVRAMSRSRNFPLHELQLDCDWTDSNRGTFFDLCREVGKLAHADSVDISSTIRLHQLRQSPPPVDRGVLMVYNTGSFKSISEENSIFSKKEIEPYLEDNRLRKYKLPLDVAWPAYGWSVGFDEEDQFVCLSGRTDFEGDPKCVKIDKNRYHCPYGIDGNNGEWRVRTVRIEKPSIRESRKVKKMIDSQLGANHSNIIYHLDSEQLSNYSDNEIKDLYNND